MHDGDTFRSLFRSEILQRRDETLFGVKFKFVEAMRHTTIAMLKKDHKRLMEAVWTPQQINFNCTFYGINWVLSNSFLWKKCLSKNIQYGQGHFWFGNNKRGFFT